ncbi:hypothetical protein V6Z12_D12G174700 [Gossypium hirsutum]
MNQNYHLPRVEILKLQSIATNSQSHGELLICKHAEANLMLIVSGTATSSQPFIPLFKRENYEFWSNKI